MILPGAVAGIRVRARAADGRAKTAAAASTAALPGVVMRVMPRNILNSPPVWLRMSGPET